jgi:NAD(P)H-flavin reductase
MYCKYINKNIWNKTSIFAYRLEKKHKNHDTITVARIRNWTKKYLRYHFGHY